MEAEMVPSLSPLLQGADQWGEVLLLLPLLVALEAVLSADNAIALAAISRRLHDPERQRQALNLGLLLALVLRMALILAARWVLDAWPLQLAAAAYLLWLCGRHLLGLDDATEGASADASGPQSSESPAVAQIAAFPAAAPGAAGHPGAVPPAPTDRPGASPLQASSPAEPHAATPGQAPQAAQSAHPGPTLASIALTLALTDLAFSLDSVAAAVAVTDRLALVMAGGLLGVLALRLTAGLFVRWLELFSRLETAGYLAVGLVGIRLLVRLLLPDLEVPEWLLLLLVSALFVWGFSQRSQSLGPAAHATDAAPELPAAATTHAVAAGGTPPHQPAATAPAAGLSTAAPDTAVAAERPLP